MSLLIVLPVTPSTAVPVSLLLTRIHDFEPLPLHRILFVTPHAFDWPAHESIRSLAKAIFGDGTAVAAAHTIPDDSYPYGYNFLFETAARHIEHHLRSPFLWLDPLCVPIRKGWLQTIEGEYATCGKPHLGQLLTPADHGTPFPQLSSVAVYPATLPKRFYQRLISQRGTPWESSCAELIVPFAAPSKNIRTIPSTGTMPTFGTAPDATPLSSLAPAVLVHTAGYRSLIAALRGDTVDTVASTPVTDVPTAPPPPSPVSPSPTSATYYHSGNLGDIIYALAAIKLAGGGRLALGPKQRPRTPPPRTPLRLHDYTFLSPLLEAQPYIASCAYLDRHPGTDNAFDLNAYRTLLADTALCARASITTIARAHCHLLNVSEAFNVSSSWLTVPSPLRTPYYILHRSPRYLDPNFPWPAVLAYLRGRLLFTGLPSEHTAFQRLFNVTLPFYQPATALDLASLIAGSQGFIGNQSLPLSIALALGHTTLQETSPTSPDCHFPRPNVLTTPFKQRDLEAWSTGTRPQQRPPTPPPPLPRSWHPTFTEQTGWPSGLFDFHLPAPNTPRGVCHFNPSIERIGTSTVLFTRRFTYSFKDHPRESVIGTSDITTWLVDPSTKKLTAHTTPSPVPLRPTNNWEDPRTIQHNNRLYLSCVTWNHPTPRSKPIVYQSLHELDAKLSVMRELPMIPLGDNGSHWEKNWTFIVHDGVWHCIYTLSPFAVHRLDAKWKPTLLAAPVDPFPSWLHGLPRGGTNPVLHNNELITFFHSSLPWRNGKRRYFMGAAALSPTPPFTPLRYTHTPLLTGSEEDPRHLGGPCVIFPCGALLTSTTWLVTFGVNDESCGWIEIPANELDALLVK